MTLPPEFLDRPIAHRGLHDAQVPENSVAAAEAAIAAGYGIELDIQHTADGTPVVFHDYDLTRLAGDEGFVADLTTEELADFRLGKSDQAIPLLSSYLKIIDGRAPLLIEIKDQDGRLGEQIGDLHLRVAEALSGYKGPVAVMSFNPHVVAAFHKQAPDIACGIVSCDYNEDDWPMIDDATRSDLASLSMFDQSGASFVSHDHKDLANPAITALRARGVPILCWTIRSPEAEAQARTRCDNITFEGYPAAT
ncbi:phosphodiesterase [Paracoccus sp. TK19116]|uniref:Phosphodiesterase n=1 Tax=Paracoccus albicereus TaxID=2922394 RepID=A0ABT1MU77_9RHOB|nr:glycerophosphodiester phosphodiesterase family protein [Paracoccus albicereus]MCQ0970878.1 phosphodiesterase [Paracoccus albicereus]